MTRQKKYLISPNIDNHILTQIITGVDQDNNPIESEVIQERSLTIFLNNQEIVTLMSIPDYPRYLAVGYLLNQNMLKQNDIIRSIDYDKDINVIVIRTKRETNYEKTLKKKITTSGCAQGTIFGDIYDEIQKIKITSKITIKHDWIYEISKKINLTPSFTPGIYGKGNGKDLGHVVEFKSEVQLSLNLFENSQFGMSYNHISNASLGEKNPGANSYMFNFLQKF